MDLKYLKQAIVLAENARGKSSPNPFVGCLIVKDDNVVGQGFTQPWGQDHAEVQALKQAGEQARGGDLYVTLEPCSHYGKTPPCAEAIIKAGLKRVFIGIKDPNPQVAGRGIAMLEAAGIEVTYNLLQAEIEQQLEYFLSYIQNNRPFVFIKSAVSIDGKIADECGNSKWITNNKSRTRVHQLRSEVDAIITGVATVSKDDAMLNVRLKDYQGKNPIRIVFDHDLEIDLKAKLVRSSCDIKTIIYTNQACIASAKAQSLREEKVELRTSKSYNGKFVIKDILKELKEEFISVVMVEAGPRLVSSFVKEGLVDKLYYFIAPSLIGGNNSAFQDIGVANIAEKKVLRLDSTEIIGGDVLLIYYFE